MKLKTVITVSKKLLMPREEQLAKSLLTPSGAMLSWLAMLPLIMLALCFMAGCATHLDPTGVYGAQTNGAILFSADSTIVNGYNAMDAFLVWEAANHAFLATNAPAAVKAANTIRAKAPQWRDTAVALRNAYASNATASNATALATGLAVIETAINQTTNYVK